MLIKKTKNISKNVEKQAKMYIFLQKLLKRN